MTLYGWGSLRLYEVLGSGAFSEESWYIVARRALCSGDSLKVVSCIPSGLRMRSCSSTSNGRPVAFSTIAAATSNPQLVYLNSVSGSYRSGCSAARSASRSIPGRGRGFFPTDGRPEVLLRSMRRVGLFFAASFPHEGKYFSTLSSRDNLP